MNNENTAAFPETRKEQLEQFSMWIIETTEKLKKANEILAKSGLPKIGQKKNQK